MTPPVQVIDETLSPTWDEMLIFKEVVLYGDIEYIQLNPPMVIIEIFDQDKMVSDLHTDTVDLSLVTYQR